MQHCPLCKKLKALARRAPRIALCLQKIIDGLYREFCR